MARRRRTRKGTSLTKTIRQYMVNFLWFGVGVIVIAALAGLAAILPDQTLTIGQIEISSRLFYNVIGFAVGIVFMSVAVHRLLRVRL